MLKLRDKAEAEDAIDDASSPTDPLTLLGGDMNIGGVVGDKIIVSLDDGGDKT